MRSDSLIDRAFAAYRRDGGICQPANDSAAHQHADKTYAVLRNFIGVLAVNGFDPVQRRLKRRLEEWPMALENY